MWRIGDEDPMLVASKSCRPIHHECIFPELRPFQCHAGRRRPGSRPADLRRSQFTTWNVEEAPGGIYAGIWQSTPGKWKIVYDEWEYFHVLEGHSVVTEEGGSAVHLKAGDSHILRPGFKGTWEVIETTRKDYVIKV